MTLKNEKPPAQAGTPQEKPSYRILLPLDRHDGHGPALFRFALALARACGGEILALDVIRTDSPEARSLWSPPDDLTPDDVPYQLIYHRNDSVSEGILEVARERKCDLILLYWRGRPHALRNQLGHVLDPILEDTPCDVALLEGDLGDGVLDDASPRFLLATAGGPNTQGAARLAFALARLYHATVTLITVVGEEADETEQEEAEAMLDQTLRGAGVSEAEAAEMVVKHVIRAPDAEEAIVAAANNHTLAFLGSTNDSVMNQLLVGTMVERLAQAIPVPVIVVKRYRGLTRYWVRRLWRTLDESLPNVPQQDRLDAYKRLRRGTRATHDFYILMLFSVIIATMGLLLNSGAVIIGAMLVAPLMTPMLGLGLGVATGETRMLRMSAMSTLKGFLLAVAVSAFLAWLAPLVAFTTEIASRTQPNLLDLTVGLAAGMAGAYSVSRKSVAAALPGVAIAAALVPPLAVVGICLATARWTAALGAALLFGTNLVAIAFAGAMMFILLGFTPPEREEQERHKLLRRGMVISLLLLFLRHDSPRPHAGARHHAGHPGPLAERGAGRDAERADRPVPLQRGLATRRALQRAASGARGRLRRLGGHP